MSGARPIKLRAEPSAGERRYRRLHELRTDPGAFALFAAALVKEERALRSLLRFFNAPTPDTANGLYLVMHEASQRHASGPAPLPSLFPLDMPDA